MDKTTTYNNYYKLFIENFETLISDIKKPTHQNGRYYINIKSENGISYYCEYTSKGYSGGKYPGFIVGLYMDGNTYKNKYELFFKYKNEIDESFDNEIIWLDTGKAGRIFFRYEANIENDKDKWLEIIKWQINKIQKLFNHIPQYIQKTNIKINFDNITQEDILKAFDEYDNLNKNNKLETNRKWKDYILFYNSKEYPHKYIVGIAYGIRNKTTTLDSQQYYSTGNQKYSAEWCINKNGFDLYSDSKYKKYLESKYQNKNTVNTYYSDLKKAIKIFQNIPALKTKKLTSILTTMINGSIDYNTYDKAQQELGFNDKQLFSTLKTKAKEYLEAISIQIQISKKKDIEMPSSQDEQPLNQILYGPPGTGKTYNTINKALEIIDINFYTNNINDRKELKDKFNAYKDSGQIEFITFHQSYGYEEFVEGIKASTEDKHIKYSVEQGIFKKLCQKAQDSELFYIGQNIGAYVVSKITSDYIDLTKKDNSIITLQKFVLNTISELIKNNSITVDDFDTDVARIRLNTFNNQIEKSHLHSYRNIYKLIAKLYIENDSSIQNTKKYILIIDEINRGNISKIFGELITLIEPSKRIGASEEITLKLPNSPKDKPFGVPQNLYIIGTMNTADRSIANIDTALRRRFEFREILPNPKLLNNKDGNKISILDDNDNITDIDVQKILEAINERIEYIYDREHTIGHSYFMGLLEKDCNTIKKLNDIFKVNIIPLLSEYFYGDWNDIKIILNDVQSSHFITKLDTPTYILDSSKQTNKVYQVNEIFTVNGYKNIYLKPKDNDVVE